MKFLLNVILLIVLISNTSLSQWIQTNGPYAKINVIEIVPDDSIIVLSTNCGYFSKKTITDKWELNSSSNFTGYTQKSDSLFVGGAGFNLINLSNPALTSTNINTITLTTLSHSDSCLYGGNSTQGFFKSNDWGNTWTSKNDGLPVDSFIRPHGGGYYYIRSIFCLEVASNFIYCGTNKGIYRNTGSLGLWSNSNSGLPIDSVTLIKEYNDTLFSAFGNELYVSSDLGNSWNLVYSAPSNITSFFNTGSQICIGTVNNGIYISTDQGLTWNVSNNGLTDLFITSIALYNSSLFCGTKTKGIFVFNGTQWDLNNDGLICSSISSLTCTDSLVVTSAWDDVYISDHNNNWTIVSPNLPHNYWGPLEFLNDTIILSVQHHQSTWPYEIPYIVYSINDGITWDSLINQPPFTGDDPYRIYTNNSRIYVYEDDNMFYTDNYGLTWTDISLTPPNCNSFFAFAVFDSVPFASACGNQQFLKLDVNSNWVLSNNGLPNDRPPGRIATCDGAVFTDVIVHGMYVSFDDGNNWSYANNGLITSNSIISSINYNSVLFVATDDYGVFVTSDYGQNWIAINEGLKNLKTTAINILDDTLYVGTEGNGIWKRAISNIHIGISNIELPLNEIHIVPNPFMSESRIYSETSFNNATIILFNSFGQELKQIKNISGQSVTLHRDNLPMGIYFLRIQNGNKNYKAKLLIVD